MKSTRLLSVLMLLQAHGRLSSRELAEKLEISERTAHRDMEALSEAGVPVYALRGAQGGWELTKGWRTKVPGLDEAELRGLLMAQPSALGDPKLAAAAERAFGKLMAALPGNMRDQAESMRARLHVDPTGWRPSSEDISTLPVVQDAIARDVKLTFMYRRADGDTAPRTVDPFGVVCKQNIWYLVARAPAGMRSYRISRMAKAVALAITFKRPAKFNLATYWKTSTSELSAQRGQYVATLALAPEAAASLRRWSPLSPAEGVQRGRELPADWVIHRVDFDSRSEAHFCVLGFGPRVEVLSPDDLREQVQADVAAAYGAISSRVR
ncbi:MAG TPA: YafY family protein [Acidobacteriaceae bacterium]|jgi:predicted DNA-binding transcriptional regulator YafY